jgi:hypothetical protein
MDQLGRLPLTVLLHLIEHFQLTPRELSRLAQLSQYYRATLRPSPDTERLWRVVLTPVAEHTWFQLRGPVPPSFVADRFDPFLRAHDWRDAPSIAFDNGIQPIDLAYVCGQIRRNTHTTAVEISGRIGDNDAASFNMLVDAVLAASALTRISITNVPITVMNMAPIMRLFVGTRLQHISLIRCGIWDDEWIARALAGNTSLTNLCLHDNRITHVRRLLNVLANCALNHLDLSNNEIRDVAPFQVGQLQNLDLRNNPIERFDRLRAIQLDVGRHGVYLRLTPPPPYRAYVPERAHVYAREGDNDDV